MNGRRNKSGSVLIITVFITALAAVLVIGMLQLNTEQILQHKNQAGLAAAEATAQAGLHDAFSQLRDNADWNAGFTDKAIDQDSYTVMVSGFPDNLTIISNGFTSQGYQSRVTAIAAAEGTRPPYRIRIKSMRINE